MNNEQLLYAVEVANCGSINQAAKKMYISQSALSISIQNLENELGKEIFIRSNKGVLLTPFGEIFLSYIAPVTDQMEQIKRLFVYGKKENEIKLSVANDSFFLVSNIIAHLINEYSEMGITIEHFDTFGNEARMLVSNRIAEVGVTHTWDLYKKTEIRQLSSIGLEYFPLTQAKLAITVGEGNELFSQRPEFITSEMLEKYPMIKHGGVEYGPYASIIQAIKLDKSSSSIVTNSRAAVSDLLQNTNGYILDSMWSRKGPVTSKMSKKGDRLIIPLKTDHNIMSEMGWVKRRKHTLSDIASRFIKTLNEEIL